MGISGRTFPISKTCDRRPLLYNINIVYNLEIVRSAQKDIKRLDRPVRIRVIDAIELLVADPYRQGARQLDRGIFRYRVGHYRIIYNVDNDTVTVRIVRVRHRSEVYREKKMKIELEATEISASAVRQNLSKIIDVVRVEGDRILVTLHGRPVAAVIGVEDLGLLQLLEDRMDVAETRRRMREPVDKVSLEELRNGLFLEDKPTRQKPKKAQDARKVIGVD